MQTPLMSGVFWEQLANSGLLSPEQIASVVRELKNGKVSTETYAAEYFVRRGLLTRYQADRLLEGRSRGFFFDNFRVMDLLGAGGMGWVYRAEDVTTGEVVAIKVLLDRLKEDRGMLARFQQEARAGLLLNHPNVVRTRTTGSAGGLVYMVLDFVEGPSLLEILVKRRRLPWALACDFARQAALGLHHAHQFGLVHRDVKPQNLLINREGQVKLLDFGLAMVREGEGGDEFSMAMIFGHECIGTPAFMAPEQATDGLTADARSDVYGLGCTLFGSLVGETPFPLRNPYDVIEAHKSQPAPSVCDFGVKIPREVGEIVAKMLAKRPEDRFQTAAEAAEALSKWSKSGPIDFNFSKILSERYRNAQERVGELHKSRPAMSGSASSTARLSKLSSVARTTDDQGVSADRSARSPREVATGIAGQRPQPAVINRQKLKSPTRDQPHMECALYLGKVLSPQGGSPPIPLIQDRIVIGRSIECDIQIPDAAVSSRHCELYFDGVTWWITDLKSRNGVLVNGKPVNRRQLIDQDTIAVANSIRLRFHDANEKPGKEFVATSKSYVFGLSAALIGLLVIYAVGFAMRLW